ncbi:excisionase family DNA binding protein [Brevundimonas nasdae]|uniref:helix-turn-helix domain-containing protein n=1 Tax=Brevundimonas nasdae TaxID=172043 RepID=UPI00278AE853|nr:excisionase family DNA binding protein [Brevundimonas nasdae]
MSAANDNGFNLAYSVAEASVAMSLSEATIYAMLADGRLERRKIGRRTLIPQKFTRSASGFSA